MYLGIGGVLMSLPFTLIEIQIDGDWIPDVKQEYLIEYQWQKDTEPIYKIGQFSMARKGLYNFHFHWGAASFQLSIDSKNMPYPDWKLFKRIWEFHRKPSDMGFLSSWDFKI